MFTSLRSRLALSAVGISLAVLVLLFSVSYVTLGEFLEDSAVSTTSHNLQIAMDVLDREVASLRQLLSFFAVNGEVQDFVASPREGEAAERKKKLAAYGILRNALYGNTLYNSINKLIIVDRQGRSIQMGSVQGHWSDAEVARKDEEAGPEHLTRVPFQYADDDTVIALSKVVYQESTGEETAWIHVTLNTSLVSKYLSDYSFEHNTKTYFLLGSSVLALGDQRRFTPSGLSSSVFAGDRMRLRIDGRDQLFVVYRGKGSGWGLAQSVPTAQFDRQNGVFLVLFVFVVLAMGLLVLLLLALVNRMVNRPIDNLQHRLAVIAGGDFTNDPSIEYRSELGDIGRGINALSRDIDELIATRIRDEQTKKSLEFRMLQNQINPHFLYNTLSSIKWMAEIQKSHGIAEVVGSLAVLLKHVAKGTDEMIPLGQELELVREFCTIQEYRTGGLAQVKFVLEDPELAGFGILKFTLQPLVENALHHGIEPSGRPGTIVVHGHRRGPDLVIDVTDDGVGIPLAEQDGLLHREPEAGGFNPIGLKNVDERLKLRFGAAYGLSVRSEVGVFTTVSVLLPGEVPCTQS